MKSLREPIGFIILSIIDAVERFSRISLIYCALHIILTHSGYRGSVDQYWNSTEQTLLWLMLTAFIVFILCSIYQHLYLQLNSDFRIVKNAKRLYQSLGIKKVLPNLSFHKFVMLGSTVLQYVFLLILLLILEYWIFALVSVAIISLCYVVTYWYSQFVREPKLIAPQFGQTILILIHIVVFFIISFWKADTIDLMLILWLFALRLSLLYGQQLIHLFIMYFNANIGEP